MSANRRRSPKTFREIAEKAAKEFVGSALTILSVYGLRKLVEFLFGHELFWDFLPLRYCQDTVDFAVFVRFLWQVFH